MTRDDLKLMRSINHCCAELAGVAATASSDHCWDEAMLTADTEKAVNTGDTPADDDIQTYFHYTY